VLAHLVENFSGDGQDFAAHRAVAIDIAELEGAVDAPLRLLELPEVEMDGAEMQLCDSLSAQIRRLV
jgi:hypothetical protein